MYGVCNISIIPMRGAPSEKAEMVSQLLFGEVYQIIETKENWIFIKTEDCHYSGWINAKMHNPLHEKGFISIGCEPCTRAVLPNQHEREGRWWWEEATHKECGLHAANLENNLKK